MTKRNKENCKNFLFFARMADDIADHKHLSQIKKNIIRFFDEAILKNKKSNNPILNEMILKFKEMPSGKNIQEICLKLL